MPIGEDPVANYAFSVEIDSQTIAQFQAVEGLKVTIETIEHKENKVGAMPIMKMLPGHVTFEPIVLKRGRINDNNLWDWIKQVQDGDIDGARKNGSITIHDYARAEIGRFNFEMGWPSEVGIDGASADSDEVMLESVTIVHEGLKVG